MQQTYELLYIIPGTKAEDEVPAMTAQIHELIKANGATIVKNDFWGKRKLAYEIDHIRYGYYDAIDFDMETTKLNILEQALRHNPTIIRSQITKRKVLTPEQVAANTEIRERIAAKREVAKEKEAAAIMTKPEAQPVEPEAAPEVAAPFETKKLDEKLEEILGSDKVDF
jgi:small subunit ribosomal protein S6